MEHNVFFPNFKYIFFTISPPNLQETTSKNEKMRNHTRENEGKIKIKIYIFHPHKFPITQKLQKHFILQNKFLS